MADVRLSEHFTLREFYNPQNYADVIDPAKAPKVDANDIDPRIIKLLEGLREKFRKTYPGAVIIITRHGGYRPDPLNKLVNGASGSKHREGNAADFRLKLSNGKYLDAPTLAVWSEKYMAELRVKGGVGMYGEEDNYIHVDARGKSVAWYDSYSSAGCPGQGGRPCIYKDGRKGAGVVLIQRWLNANGYPCGSEDGKYGSKTADAVKKFQRDVGLAADGIFGSATNGRMGGVLPW